MVKLSAERSSFVPKPSVLPSSVLSPELTNRQRTVLRGLGHHLNPVAAPAKTA